MPKRSTPFQKLIKKIYSQLEDEDATVAESVMVKEKGADSEREVDVLITKTILGKELNIAVECREWTKKNDITWIDCLIGKYIDLEIKEVIAVSKSGFYKPAEDKAKFHNIKTLSLKQANEVDWKQKFLELFLNVATRNDFPTKIEFETEQPIDFPVSLQTPIFSGENQIGTIEQVGKQCYESSLEKINQEIEKIIFSTGLKAFENTMDISFSCDPSQEIYFIREDKKTKFKYFRVEMKGRFDICNIKPKQYFFDDAGIIEETITDSTGKFHQIIVSQKVGKDPVMDVYPVE